MLGKCPVSSQAALYPFVLEQSLGYLASKSLNLIVHSQGPGSQMTALKTSVIKGSVIDLETFITISPQGWAEVRGQIDQLHDQSKVVFFRQLLTVDAIRQLEPEY